MEYPQLLLLNFDILYTGIINSAKAVVLCARCVLIIQITGAKEKQLMKNHSFWDSIYTKFLLKLLSLAFIPIVLVISIFFYMNQQNNASAKYELNDRVTNSIITNINNNREFTTRTIQSLCRAAN